MPCERQRNAYKLIKQPVIIILACDLNASEGEKDLTTDQKVGSSNLPGRAIFFNGLFNNDVQIIRMSDQ